MNTRKQIGCRPVVVGRAAIACAGATIALGLLAGCGSGSGASSTAVIVNGHRIPSSSVAQSMYGQVAASNAFAGRATKNKPPEPPDFEDCIAYFKKYEPKPRGPQASLTPIDLKQRCRYEYEKEKLKALYFLIPYEWVAGEAAELGVHISQREVAQRLALFEGNFPSKAALSRYMRLAKESRSTLEARMRLGLWSTRIEEALHARLHALPLARRQAKLRAYGEAFEAKWRARTDCKTGYVVPLCRQYKPPRTPSTLVPPSVPLTNIAG